MTVPFANVPQNLRVPLFYAEVNNSMANTATFNQRALIIGQMTATGLATPNVPVISQSVSDAITQGGQGSMLALMTAAYRLNDSFGELWYLPLADDPTAVAAGGALTIVNAPSTPGVLSIYIAGNLVSVSVNPLQTTAQIATAIAVAINANPNLPVYTTGAGDYIIPNMVKIIAKNKGLAGNDIDLRLNYRGASGGEVLPAGMGITITAFAGGLVNPALNIALANLGSAPFDFIVCPYTDTTSLDLLDTTLNDKTGRWSWDEKIYGHVFAANRGTLAAQTTFGAAMNSQHETVLAINGTPTLNYVFAAAMTGACAVSLKADPGMPLHTLPVLGVLAAPIQNQFAIADRNTLLYSGMSTHTTQQDGSVLLEGIITTYQKNAFNQPDNSYLKVETMFLLMYVLRALEGRVTSKYGRMKLADDGTRFAAGSAIVTPNIIRADLIAMYRELEYNGYVQNANEFKAALIVQRNATNPNRLDVLYPGVLINQLDVLALLFQFRLT